MKRRLIVGAVCAGLLSLIAVGAASAPFAFRTFALPAPTGPYRVGTTQILLSRGRTVAVWYPAVTGRGRRARYGDDPNSQLPVRAHSVRERIVRSLMLTNADQDAPAEPHTHPLLVYVPAWGGRRSDNTAHVENLASHGYIVVGMDDPFPALHFDLSSDPAYRRTLISANRKVRTASSVVSDVITALQSRAAGGQGPPVVARMNFERIGILGYSFGGATAAETARLDRRVRAAVNLDGWTFGQAATDGVAKPFLLIGTGAATLASAVNGNDAQQAARLGPFEDRLEKVNSQQISDGFRRYGGWYLRIDGTTHESFCDTALLPFFRDQVRGGLDNRRAYAITAAYLVAFFGSALSNVASPLLPVAAPGVSRSPIDTAAHLEVWQRSST